MNHDPRAPFGAAFLASLMTLSACGDTGLTGPPDDAAADAGDTSPDVDASSDSGSPPDGGDDARMPPVDCETAADCDDGDPATEQMCFTVGGAGHCVYIECTFDSDCDDGDPWTVDACVVDDELSRRCQATRLPGRCEAAADCATVHDCESATCNEAGFCDITWSDGCGVVSTRTPVCEPGVRLGSACCDGPICTPRCVPSGEPDDCPTEIVCDRGRYRESSPAGPTCPSSPCPASPPAVGSACTDEGRICDFDPGALVRESEEAPSAYLRAGPTCECSAGVWTCTGSWCPYRPPAHLSPARTPAWARPGSTRCDYRGRRCTAYLRDSELLWHCEVDTLACGLEAPRTGDACVPGYEGNACNHRRDRPEEPADTFTGECSCEPSGTWQCSESRSSDCPAAAPGPLSVCTRSRGNAECVYFDSKGEITCYCDGFGDWSCTEPRSDE